MSFNMVDIEVAPKNISWVGMPVYLNDRDRFELLKRDIFIHDCHPGNITGIKAVQNKHSACLFNLDNILLVNKKTRLLGSVPISLELARFIRGNQLNDSFVHTTVIDDKVNKVFNDFKIPLVQRDMQYRSNAFTYINERVIPLLFRTREPREFVRLKFYPYRKIIVGVQNLTQGAAPRVTATLKDASLNGIGLVLKEKDLLRHFQLGDFLRLTIMARDFKLNVTSAFLTRISDEESIELGVKFNIEDEIFISRPDAQNLMRIIYSALKDVTNEVIRLNTQQGKYKIL